MTAEERLVGEAEVEDKVTHPHITSPLMTHPNMTHPLISHPNMTHPLMTHPNMTHPLVTHPHIHLSLCYNISLYHDTYPLNTSSHITS